MVLNLLFVDLGLLMLIVRLVAYVAETFKLLLADHGVELVLVTDVCLLEELEGLLHISYVRMHLVKGLHFHEFETHVEEDLRALPLWH